MGEAFFETKEKGEKDNPKGCSGSLSFYGEGIRTSHTFVSISSLMGKKGGKNKTKSKALWGEKKKAV